MAWNTPITWLANQLVTALQMNEQISDNMNFLGGMEYDGVLVSALTAGTNLAKLQRLATYPIGFVGDLSQVDDVVLGGENIWLRVDGRTIGNVSSGADIVDDMMEDLFTHLWTEFADAELPIFTSGGAGSSRGGSAAADWAANKRMSLLDIRGRVVGMMDDPTGADAADVVTDGSADTLGDEMGAEDHTLTVGETPTHSHVVKINSASEGSGAYIGDVSRHSAQIAQVNTETSGSGNAHNNMQPTFWLNKFIYTGN